MVVDASLPLLEEMVPKWPSWPSSSRRTFKDNCSVSRWMSGPWDLWGLDTLLPLLSPLLVAPPAGPLLDLHPPWGWGGVASVLSAFPVL